MNKSNQILSVNEVFSPEHKPKHKPRKLSVWHKQKPPNSTSQAHSHSQPMRKHSTGFSQDTSATSRNSPRHRNHSTSGYWESSSTGSRKSKNQCPIGTLVSEPELSTVAIVFVFGLSFLLLGYWFGHNARGVEELGKKHGGVQYILPEQSPSSVPLQRVSI